MKKFTRFLSALLVLCMVLSLAPAVFAADTAEFTFLVTSDLHGQIFATDYTVDQSQSGTYKRGLTRVSSYVEEVRAAKGAENVFLADIGDTIQGAPLTYYYAFQKPEVDDPAVKAMRMMGYDMWVVGNHEFNYGKAILDRQLAYATSEAKEGEVPMNVTMANYLKAETNSDETKDWATWHDYAPYVVKEYGGVKVAVIGFGNPNVPKWDVPANWEGIYFADIIETYKHYEAEMLEAADMIVVMAHSGIGSDEGADFMERLVEATNTISFAFSGHEHGKSVVKIKNADGVEVPVLQPYTKARAIAQVDVSYNKATGTATVAPAIVNTEGEELDEELVEALQPYEDAVWEEYMNVKIGEASGDFSAEDLGTAPSAFMDLINTVQLWGAYDRTGENTPETESDNTMAQLSISAPLTSGDNANIIDQGDIHLGDMFKLYRFENWFYQITMSGKEVRTWLEFAATKIRVDAEGKPYVTAGDLTYYDVIYGEDFSYVVDYDAPEGSRVVSMTYKGLEVADNAEFTVVVNNYRYNGGGNYVKYLNENGCEFTANDPDRIIYSTQFDMIQGEDEGQARTLLMRYIEEQKVIDPITYSTWKLDKDYVNDDITIFYTNDVHTYIDGELSYDNIAELKDTYEAKGLDVLLLDAGDHIQGTAYGSMDKGETIIELMSAAGYDAATLGNHEFDYGMDRALELIGKAGYPYLSANFYNEKDGVKGESVLDAYKIFELGGKKLAVVGVTTPETFTKSTPKYFQDEEGNYIYGISGGEDGAALYADVQAAIDAAKEAGAEIIIGLGHLGDDPSSIPWTSEELIANVSGLDAFIDGHSHSENPCKEVEDKEGKTVILTQTGNYFDAIGKLTISSEGVITAELVTEYAGSDEETAGIKNAWIAEVDELLGAVIAESEVDFQIKDESGRLIRKQETNLGDFTADALYFLFAETEGLEVDAAIMNGGGIRADMLAGDITYKTCKTVHTFGNVACLITVTGQQILDALEWGAQKVGVGENGGFLQVSGITYEIHSYIESTVQADEKGVWCGGPTGEYRVKNVTIGGEPLDVNATYNLAGYNYTLRDLGDGFAMFGGAGLVKDYVMEDYLVLANYVKGFPEATIKADNSPLGAYYGDYKGEGRITIVEEAQKPELSFSDVAEGVWYYEYIMEMAELGFIEGYEDGTFRPEGKLTRAAMAALLYRMAGSPPVEGTTGFTDIPENAWYVKEVTWAEQQGIVEGVGDDRFAPESFVTREQLVTMIYRLVGETEVTGGLSGYADTQKVSDWALEAFKWAVEAEIINGKTVTGVEGVFLDPQGNATRAEAAKILLLFYKLPVNEG